MFYYLFLFLNELDFPGAGVFQYISFRSGMAIITSLIVSMMLGKRIINFLLKKQIGETVRDLGLNGQKQKQGTPTMGGTIIIGSILLPVLLFAKLHNVYIILMIITTVWLGFIGFLDDYIKIYKKDKKGLSGKFKVLGQISLGLIVGLTLYISDDVVVRDRIEINDYLTKAQIIEITDDKDIQKVEVTIEGKTIIKKELQIKDTLTKAEILKDVETGQQMQARIFATVDHKSTKTTIPFFKNNEFDYEALVAFTGKNAKNWAWLVFVLIVIFIITAVSNGANITDGLDGLATGSSAIMGSTLVVLAYVSGNIIFSDYLNIMYIPFTGELVIFGSAFIGATIGFLWYNSFPAQVFMGDTGSLTLGGIIAVFAIIIRKELLIPVLCGVFLVENLSVLMQVSYFKYTKKKFGTGRRILKMSPLHHHYQKVGLPESKIVTRFWIVGLLLAVFTIITLKLR